ncbi:hypothetical protein AAF712_011174 [Marasmius tenuissimus]|uniref:Uncharacterized protein n=1 Tax=Marasmius tenuissimus TaxID=585030 RepID=A0ABR2ZJY5_9AGAR
MRAVTDCLLLFLLLEKIYALQVSFTSPPTAATPLSFTWVKELGDGGDVWIRKQKQRENTLPTLISHPYQVHLGDRHTGSSGIDFLEAG